MKLDYLKATILLVLIFLLVQIPFLSSITRVWMDEPWYANVGYNFAQGEGLVDMITRDGKPFAAFLYPLILGIFFKFFACSVWVGRSASVVAGAFALAGLIKIQRLWKIKPWIVLTTGLLFIINNVYYVVFRTIRPESWCVAFAVWALFFLAKGAREHRLGAFLWSAFLVACSVFCHPHGALFALLFGLFILGYSVRRKDWKPVAGYAGVGLICILAWAFYYTVLCGESVGEFFFGASGRTVADEKSMATAVITSIKTFCQNYSLGIKRLYILVFEVGILIAGIFFGLRKDRRLFLCSLCGLLFFGVALVVFHPLSTRHFGEVLIFSLLATSLFLQNYPFTKKTLMALGLCCAIGLYGLNNFAGTAYLLYRDHGRTPFGEISARIDKQIPDNQRVLSLMPFWFGVRNSEFYNGHTRWKLKGFDSLQDFLENGNPDYFITTPYQLAGKTGTSGRKDDSITVGRQRRFYNSIREYAEHNAVLLDSFRTKGYDEIRIWFMAGKEEK